MKSKEKPLEGIPKQTVLGSMTCECGRSVDVQVDAAGVAYAYCIRPDGGCGKSVHNRGTPSTLALLAQIEQWRDGQKKRVVEVLAAQGLELPDAPPRRQPKRKPRPADPPPPAADDAPPPPPPADDDGGSQWWQ